MSKDYSRLTEPDEFGQLARSLLQGYAEREEGHCQQGLPHEGGRQAMAEGVGGAEREGRAPRYIA